MAKVQALWFFAAVFLTAYGYPLEEEPTSNESSDQATPTHGRVVSPLVRGQVEQQQKISNISENQSRDNSSGESFIEETYVEILFPAIPRLNSTLLESLLNESLTNSTNDTSRSVRDTSANSDSSEETQNSTLAPVPYVKVELDEIDFFTTNSTSNKDGVQANSSDKAVPAVYSRETPQGRSIRDAFGNDSASSTISTSSSTIAPVLYSQNVKRGISDADDLTSNSTSRQENNQTRSVRDASDEDQSKGSSTPSSSQTSTIAASLYAENVKRGVDDRDYPKDNSSSNREYSSTTYAGQGSSTPRAVPALSSQNITHA